MNLVLIDGNAIMHRAYHALPPLTNKDGIQTNAVYGFFTMLFTIINKCKPSHLIVCFDRPEPTFRKSMYVGYQAHRPKMDDALSGQFGVTKEIITTMTIPIYEVPGYEADDIIGTLANQASKINNFQVTIITGDRDILQLVNDRISVYMPVNGLNNGKLYEPKNVEEKYGVTSAQIVDLKALMGDASDNYPGVRGIGPKTARNLLQLFGTLESLYAAIEKKDERLRKFSDKTIQALSEYAEDAGMAKKLAKIITDVPVTLDIKKAQLYELNTPEAMEVLQKYGFWSLIKRMNTIENGKLENEKSDAKKETAHDEKIDHEQLSLV